MALEIESKLALPSAAMAADIVADSWVRSLAAGPWQQMDILAVYYDTPDGALQRRHCGLRVRREGTITRVAMKMPSPQELTRYEWQCEAQSLADALPLLAAQGAPVDGLELAQLQPLYTIDFTRTYLELTVDDISVELALDDGIITVGEHTKPLRELELELKSGDSGALHAVTEAFMARFGLAVEPRSKLQRAQAMRDTP